MPKLKIIVLFVAAILLINALLIALEVWLAFRGPIITSTDPPQSPRHFTGRGPHLRYVVLGDSTAVGRGAGEDQTIAVATARHLAESYDVTMFNVGVSGACINDVLKKQLSKAEALKPDVCLLSVGANDVIHFTTNLKIKSDLKSILSDLTKSNAKISIVVPGSGDVGACTRFEQPLRFIAGLETERVNRDMEMTTRMFPSAVLVPLAERTGRFFKQDDTLFSEDKFHPNNRGYATWTPVINEGLDQALANSKL